MLEDPMFGMSINIGWENIVWDLQLEEIIEALKMGSNGKMEASWIKSWAQLSNIQHKKTTVKYYCAQS